MAMRVSIDGGTPVPVSQVVVYHDDVPVSVCVAMGQDVVYADAIRDPDFLRILATIGVHPSKLPAVGPIIRGNIR